MKYMPPVAVPITLLMSLSNPVHAGSKPEPDSTIQRRCAIQASFSAEATVAAITMEDICAQDLFELLSHESVQISVAQDGVVTKVGEGIVCKRKPTSPQDFTYDCVQLMSKAGGILPGSFTSPDDDLFDRLEFSRISINGSTASKIYQFLNVPAEDIGALVGSTSGTFIVKDGDRISCSERIFNDGRPPQYQCGQRLKTNGVSRGAGNWEMGSSITVGNMRYLHESYD